MAYLIAIVVLVGVLCLLDLVLTLGVVRRLKEHTKLVDALYEIVGTMGAPAGPAVGEVVGEFDAATVDGTRVTRDQLPDQAVVAFLSPDCRGCREQLPAFTAWAADQDRPRVFVVVDSQSADTAELVATLAPVAQVIAGEAGEPVGKAFGVQTFPTFFQVAAGGKLLAMAPEISRLAAGAPA
ncbi:hypothetical protein [Nonomuraea sediminis]|uniref:hypothetical protein n=1 Tax=Nonomuraea sediminis TaxID=2835864 RepID=UPI001BDD7BEC|nr:hypothetical protein [Nonomuraea sediminis]